MSNRVRDDYNGERPVRKVRKKKVLKKRRYRLHLYSKLLLIVDLCAVICFVTAYGPFAQFRDWLVTTALSTAHHRYFAYVLYSEEYVKEIVANNQTVETDTSTDVSAISFVEHQDGEVYASIYEEQILKKDEGNDMYKVIEINEDKYKGYITVIYHPERLDLAMAKGKAGDTITEFAKDNKAIVAVNGGGYKRRSDDTIYSKGNIIYQGTVYKTNNSEEARIIGMNYDGVLVLATSSAKQCVAEGMKWGVQFGPFLVVNGEPTQFKGNGGYGVQPRTAIGQRQDGIVILVTIDGRGAGGSSGISMPDLTELMVRYGCYNAANLDGGGSTMLAIEGKLHNNPKGYGYSGERHVYNAIIYK